MKDLLRLASILDGSGHFSLSDKLFRVAQYQSNYNQITPAMQTRRLQELYYIRNQEMAKLNELKEQFANGQITREQYQNAINQFNNNPAVVEIQKIQSGNVSNQSPSEYSTGYQSNMPQDLSGTRVMDGSQYLNNPYTPKGVMDIRRQLVPTNFRNELSRYESGDNLLNSSNPTSFATSLFEFARRNRLNSSLVKAFDAYADAGATYNGQSIKNIPQLKNLYMYVRNNNKMFSQTEIAQLLSQAFTGPLG